MPSDGRNAQLVRLINLLRDLDRLGGSDVYDLAERHGVTTRTILRDLQALEYAGIPLDVERDGKRNRHRIGFKSQARQVAKLLDANHYLALRVAMGQGGAVRSSSSVFANLEDLAAKIESMLGPADRKRLAAVEACFHSYEKFAWQQAPPDVLWPLVEAIADRRLCTVCYAAARPDGKQRSYSILPLKLFAHDGAVYLMCHHPGRDKVLTLNLSRLKSLVVTDERGVPPAHFDPSHHEQAAFGVTRGGPIESWSLRFSAAVAPFLRERQWHPTQKITEEKGGSLLLDFRCEGSVEVFAWVASWHDQVEILSPESARAQMRAFGTWILNTYPSR